MMNARGFPTFSSCAVFGFVSLLCALTFMIGNYTSSLLATENFRSLIQHATEQNIDLMEDIRKCQSSKRKWRDDLINLSKRTNSLMKENGIAQCKDKNVTSTGGWCNWPLEQAHYKDEGLFKAFQKLLNKSSVASFGEGIGYYKTIGTAKRFDAFDGSPLIEKATNGSVRFLDLSIPQFSDQSYDWLLCLEVAEHIPRRFESIFLDNLQRHTQDMLIISWARENQLGFEHVNPRSPKYVKEEMENRGFDYDSSLTRTLRRAAKLPWFRRNLLVFQKTGNTVDFRYTEERELIVF